MTALDLLDNLDDSAGTVSLKDEQTQVLFGAGTAKRLGQLARELNGQRVLLVTDQGLARAGHEQHAVESLKSAGLRVTVFDEVQHDPTTADVERGLLVAQQAKIDLIVGLGGGSSMDCAKGINFLLTNGGRMEDYWGFGKASQPMLPLIAIPTTAGTGSEAQSFALIANSRTHMKMACGDKKAAARIAILDPELTLSMPPSVCAATGIDAISHAIESHVTTARTALSGRFSRRAWQLLSLAFPAVICEEQPGHTDETTLLSDAGAMLLGAHFAGAAIENSMLGATHALANPLSAHFGLTHGVAIAVMLPHVIRFNADSVSGLYGELAADAGLCSADDPQAGKLLAARIVELASLVDLPISLAECGIHRTMIPVMAAEAAAQWTAKFNPRPVDITSLQELYECAMQ
ncbi:MAG: iron-containing alcohol dehydrogenase [Planctomycetaceae bacterium]